MNAKNLIDSGILHDGEARHYNGLSITQVPRLNLESGTSTGQALYRRQKAFAPQTRRHFGALNLFIQAMKQQKKY